MATENKKMKDPAEAALSAVEQALNLDETFVIHTPERPGGKSSFEEPKLPDIDDHDFTKGPFGLGSDSLSAQADDHDRQARRDAPLRLRRARPELRRQRRPPECRHDAAGTPVSPVPSRLLGGRPRLPALARRRRGAGLHAGHHHARTAAGRLLDLAAGARRLRARRPPLPVLHRRHADRALAGDEAGRPRSRRSRHATRAAREFFHRRGPVRLAGGAPRSRSRRRRRRACACPRRRARNSRAQRDLDAGARLFRQRDPHPLAHRRAGGTA